jgi:multidrug efflux pump subunit AcrA (membrane-fusion protein)
MRRVGSLCAALALASQACSSDLRQREEEEKEVAPAGLVAEIGGEAVIVLSGETVNRIGLRTATLKRATHPVEIELPGVIIADPGAAAAVRSGVSGRLAEATGRPWPRAGEWLSGGEAIAQVGDARPVIVPRSGTVTRLLAQPGELVQAGQTLIELTDYASPLARIAWSPDAPSPPREVAIATLGSGRRLTARLEGPGPEADPVTRGPAFLYRIPDGGSSLRPGAAVAAYLPEAGAGSMGGVEIPGEAVVQWEALAWAYVERAAGRYARVRVATDHPVPGGWRVAQGFSAGDRVVTTGAGQLLSEEFRARIVVGEEVGE